MFVEGVLGPLGGGRDFRWEGYDDAWVDIGGHLVWIDPESEAVVVARWLDGAQSAGFVERVAQGLAS